MALIVLDAGHGGANPGAVYNGRQEKDDAGRIHFGGGRGGCLLYQDQGCI